MRKKKNGIARSFAQMTIIPLVLFGMITAIFSVFWITESIVGEVHNELHYLSEVTIEAVDRLYPGDYVQIGSEDALLTYKGDTILSSNYALIDSLKDKTGMDYSIFYGDTRIITTLRDHEGNRLVGTQAGADIIQTVQTEGKPAFYSSINVVDSSYYSYYTPLYNSDGTCVGMFATLMPSERGFYLLMRVILPIVLLSFVVIVFALLWSHRYAAEFITIIRKLSCAFERASLGDLSNSIPQELLTRTDEFGMMSNSLMDMQDSLRTLVEHDALTGLYNRRFGQQKLDQTYALAKEGKTEFSIALGDIDFFKRFNDTNGHECGDYVLKQTSLLIQKHVGTQGYCIRWGGEEFLILFVKGSYEDHTVTTEHLLEDIRNTSLSYHGLTLSITMTWGILKGDTEHTCDELVEAADQLLYYGKENGRNCMITEKKSPEPD